MRPWNKSHTDTGGDNQTSHNVPYFSSARSKEIFKDNDNARSKEAFKEIDEDTSRAPIEKTIAKAKAVVENSSARGRARTLENAVLQFNRLARGIAKTAGETNSKKIAQMAKDILTTYIHGDIKQISNDSTFKTLTKALLKN